MSANPPAPRPPAPFTVEQVKAQARQMHEEACWPDGVVAWADDELRATMLDAYAQSLETAGWRPIAEAPKDGTLIIASGPLGPEIIAWHGSFRGWLRGGNTSLSANGYTDGENRGFTIWQPLPLPPSRPEEGKC